MFMSEEQGIRRSRLSIRAVLHWKMDEKFSHSLQNISRPLS